MTEVKKFVPTPVKIITVQKGNTLPPKYSVPTLARQNAPLNEGVKDKTLVMYVSVNKSNQVVGVAGVYQQKKGLAAAAEYIEHRNAQRNYNGNKLFMRQHVLRETERILTPGSAFVLDKMGSVQKGVGTQLVNKVKSVGRDKGIKTIEGYTHTGAKGFYKKQGGAISKSKVNNPRGNRYEFIIKLGRRRK